MSYLENKLQDLEQRAAARFGPDHDLHRIAEAIRRVIDCDNFVVEMLYVRAAREDAGRSNEIIDAVIDTRLDQIKESGIVGAALDGASDSDLAGMVAALPPVEVPDDDL